MPRLSTTTRDRRRAHILEAARACVDEVGLEAVSMELIVARTGMSTGAVYRYFAGKDEVLAAAIVGGMEELLAVIEPILARPDPLPPPALVAELTRTVAQHCADRPTDLTRIALHGWSHSRSDERLAAAIRTRLLDLRSRFEGVAERWRESGVVAADADPAAIGTTLLTISLGFVAMRGLLGAADPDALAAGLAGLGGA